MTKSLKKIAGKVADAAIDKAQDVVMFPHNAAALIQKTVEAPDKVEFYIKITIQVIKSTGLV